MEYLPKDRILEFNTDTLLEVRKCFGFDKPQEMREAIDILDNWVQKQNHFVKKDFDREYLERLIIACKGSIEKSKSRLDKMCTLRTLMPNFFDDYDIRKDLTNIGSLIYLAMPKLTKENYRVFIVKCSGDQFSSSLFLDAYRFISIFMDYIRSHDYCICGIILVDIMEASLSKILKELNLLEMRQLVTLSQEGYGARVKGIHMFTTSNVIDTMVSIMKQMMSAKAGERIHVHRSLEAVNKFVPKDVLPIEYGGNERSFAALSEEWIDVLNSKEFRDYRREMKRACTDESLRQTDTFNEQYMGMPGTFRSLSVD